MYNFKHFQNCLNYLISGFKYKYTLGFSSLLFFSTLVFAEGTGNQPTRFRVTNQCAEDIWVQQDFKSYTDKNQIVVKIPSNSSHDYQIPSSGLPATRFWAKSGCNEHGYNCKVGESTAVPEAEANKWQSAPYAPDINSKFEATWGCISGQCIENPSSPGNAIGSETWWNGSAVDGYTFPYEVVVKNHNNSCRDLHSGRIVSAPGVYCGDLKPESCPTSANLSTEGKFNQINGKDVTKVNLQWKDNNGKAIGCFSPCAKLTTAQGNYYSENSGGWKYFLNGVEPEDPEAQMYCCPTPPVSNQECIDGPASRSEYSKSVSVDQACNSYTYAYDDAQGLARCGGNTQFELVFCPSKKGEPQIIETDMKFVIQEPQVVVKYNDEVIDENIVYKIKNGSTVSEVKDNVTLSCPLMVNSLSSVLVETGGLCDKLSIDNTKKIITILANSNPTPSPSLSYKYKINYPGVANIKAYLNDNLVARDAPLQNASSALKISDLKAVQDAKVGSCNILFEDNGITKGGFGEFCSRIVIFKDGEGNYFVNLPADIPDSENKPLPNPDNNPLPNPDASFTFQLNFPSAVTANVNQTSVENAQKLDASKFPRNSFITALQGGNLGVCNFVIETEDANIVKGGGELCNRINIVKESNNIHMFLPAAIPNTGEITPAPEPQPTPDPTPNPDPTPAPEPSDPTEPPAINQGDKYASFGIAAGINTIFGSYNVSNGTKVGIKDLVDGDIELSATQNNNTVGCTIKKSGDNLSIVNNSGVLCAQGLVVQRHGDGNYYIGLPNPLPANK